LISTSSVIRIATLLSLFLMTQTVSASDYVKCMQDEVVDAASEVTVGEMQQHCQSNSPDSDTLPKESNVDRRIRSQAVAWDDPFVLSVHRPNYLLVLANNADTNEAPFETQFPDENVSLDDTEAKFQISVKFPLALDLFDGKGAVFFAFTARAFWQLYNSDSAPFRETDYEPELFLSLKSDFNVFGFTNKLIDLGIIHQSNGRAGTLSRSWNRIFALFVLEKDDLAIGFKPWLRIPENAEGDDNPDIEEFMGNFELTTVYSIDKHTVSAMIRNNLDASDNKGAIQLDWIFPLNKNINGYVQYFNGYGESIIDYNYKQESIGIGFALSTWL